MSGAALERLPQDKKIVLHCKSGARSAEALAVVKNAGFSDAVHVGGGVLAWVSQGDPALPAYEGPRTGVVVLSSSARPVLPIFRPNGPGFVFVLLAYREAAVAPPRGSGGRR